MLANLARSSPTFRDLDPRRVEALKICTMLWSDCYDLTPYLYKKVMVEAQSPYLLNDRHLSLFGNRVLAEHYVSLAALKSAAETADADRNKHHIAYPRAKSARVSEALIQPSDLRPLRAN
jgi:hypothetical protein